MLEATAGKDKVDAALHNHFNKWKLKHPEPADMQAAFEEAIGSSLAKFFHLTKQEGAFE